MSCKNIKIKHVMLCSLVFLILSFVAVVSASDVAYIYKNERRVDQNVLDVFSDMSLSVELISERNLPANLSMYGTVFLGNERFTEINEISNANVPVILMNKYYGKQFGLMDRGSIGQLGATTPLHVYTDGKNVQVYETTSVRKRISSPYYYVPEKYCAHDLENVASTEKMFSRTREGSVVSHRGDVCFFGIIASDYWTNDAKKLFTDCVAFAVGSDFSSCDIDSDCGGDGAIGENFCYAGNVMRNYKEFTCVNPGTSQSSCSSTQINQTVQVCTNGCENGVCTQSSGSVHNIGFVNVTNSVGMIRLQTMENEDILDGESVQCNEKYKIAVRVKNLGNFSENVSFDGSLGPLEIDHGTIESLEPGSTSDRTKTVNFTLPAGTYDLALEALLDGFIDSNPLDNIMGRKITIVCGEPLGGACSSDDDCLADSFSGLYCSSGGDSYKDLIYYTCQNPGLSNSACVPQNTPQLVEDCDFGCSGGSCLPEQSEGIHDVALVNVTNTVGLIRIREDGVDVPAGEHLQCNQKYQIIVRAKNLGNFTENVTFAGSFGSLELDYSLAEIDSTKTADRTKTLNVTLSSGTYDIEVEAILESFADVNPLNNVASKQVIVEC